MSAWLQGNAPKASCAPWSLSDSHYQGSKTQGSSLLPAHLSHTGLEREAIEDAGGMHEFLTSENGPLSGVRNSGSLSRSKPRIYWFVLQSHHTEYTFMGAAKRFLANEPVESFDIKNEFTARE